MQFFFIQTDHTWSLLETKGFLEQMGPENVFKSETKFRHTTDERFMTTVRMISYPYVVYLLQIYV